jgi:predicted  nucleic acid-binding Zn-ribbon protein
MSSSIGGLSAAKRRRGSSQSTNTASRQQTISAPQNDINSNMIQVSPLEMLKMHESRLRRIESMENGTDKQLPDFDEIFSDIMADLEEIKQKDVTDSVLIRDLKATVRSMQGQSTTNSRLIASLQNEISSIKTDITTMKLSVVSLDDTTNDAEPSLADIVEEEQHNE